MNRAAKILWAVDVLSYDAGQRRRMVEALREAQRAYDAVVVPIHVISPTFPLVGTALHAPDPVELRQSALEGMRRYLRGVKLPRLAAPEVVMAPNGSLRGRVAALLEAAHARKAVLIALSTFSRKGVPRLLMGSFTETLMTRSDIPLLVVNPTTSPAKGPLLFATDFGARSLALLPEIAALAKKRGMPLVLFHHLPPLVQYAVEPLTQITLYRMKQRKQTARLKAEAERLRGKLRAEGVSATAVLSRKGASPAESILHGAKALRARLIVMATEKDPLRAGVLGSTSRRVVRGSRSPVWVLHQ